MPIYGGFKLRIINKSNSCSAYLCLLNFFSTRLFRLLPIPIWVSRAALSFFLGVFVILRNRLSKPIF